ncbi:biotin transport system substrate-specific component [Nakamurella panacisegetis]|uniref:Biotin transporter n=1 Tax=Nakamurella panacisegetis TaxID=1090615 RepID=A0A1H0NIL6_9ACTN|nr:biotin transporter BioY [Nakamurella panacisegetis]SDO92461.1 biotin transport system substrate-specific component [Nakamurella panacisegetis]
MAEARTATEPHSRSATTDLALVAVFAALIAGCALMPAINVSALVPITLQTFGVLLTGAVLGARRGFLAVLLYLAVGAAGLPVFSGGRSGLSVFSGPTVGYLVAFPLAAALCGLIVERLPRRSAARSVPLVFLAGLVGSAVFIHTFGVLGLMWRAHLSFGAAFDVDRVFWVGDILKNVLMALVATAVHRAFPDLLRKRR